MNIDLNNSILIFLAGQTIALIGGWIKIKERIAKIEVESALVKQANQDSIKRIEDTINKLEHTLSVQNNILIELRLSLERLNKKEGI